MCIRINSVIGCIFLQTLHAHFQPMPWKSNSMLGLKKGSNVPSTLSPAKRMSRSALVLVTVDRGVVAQRENVIVADDLICHVYLQMKTKLATQTSLSALLMEHAK
jgi:hypothetical protein